MFIYKTLINIITMLKSFKYCRNSILNCSSTNYYKTNNYKQAFIVVVTKRSIFNYLKSFFLKVCIYFVCFLILLIGSFICYNK